MVSGWIPGAALGVHGKDGKKHHVDSVLNPSFVAESRVESRQISRVINVIKCQHWEKSERR